MRKILVFLIASLLYTQSVFGSCTHTIENLIKWEPVDQMMSLYIDQDNDGIADIIYYMGIINIESVKCSTDCSEEKVEEFRDFYTFTSAVIPGLKETAEVTAFTAEILKKGESASKEDREFLVNEFNFSDNDEREKVYRYKERMLEDIIIKERLVNSIVSDPLVYQVSKECMLSHDITDDERKMEKNREKFLTPKEW